VLPVKASVTVVDSSFHAKGDANWDGFIDGNDLELVRAAMGSFPGKPNWNADADLNGDGKVDITDLTLCIKNQGQMAAVYQTPSKADVPEGKCVVIGSFRGQQLRKEFKAGTRIFFIFSAFGMLGRAALIPV